ncbi:hypothetical protein K438DRAFT_1835641 [Mycena galopus ATCC 62051]|nr:hypothetical protein K438DRAFT_1835641 [Mycena galopus ATCC 62051]
MQDGSTGLPLVRYDLLFFLFVILSGLASYNFGRQLERSGTYPGILAVKNEDSGSSSKGRSSLSDLPNSSQAMELSRRGRVASNPTI